MNQLNKSRAFILCNAVLVATLLCNPVQAETTAIPDGGFISDEAAEAIRNNFEDEDGNYTTYRERSKKKYGTKKSESESNKTRNEMIDTIKLIEGFKYYANGIKDYTYELYIWVIE